MKKQVQKVAQFKYLVFIMSMMLTSCSLFKQVPQTPSRNGSPFFENIAVTLAPQKKATQSAEQSQTMEEAVQTQANYISEMPGIEFTPPIVFRYAVLLDIEVERLSNRKLIEYVHQWWAVPYRIGGSSMEGIDCSGFVKGIAAETYGIQLPRTSREQADFSRKIDKAELKEGDLVFFSQGRSISHVGMYISNNKFVHASTSMGVVISDLDEPYWKRRFVRAGKINPQ